MRHPAGTHRARGASAGGRRWLRPGRCRTRRPGTARRGAGQPRWSGPLALPVGPPPPGRRARPRHRHWDALQGPPGSAVTDLLLGVLGRLEGRVGEDDHERSHPILGRSHAVEARAGQLDRRQLALLRQATRRAPSSSPLCEVVSSSLPSALFASWSGPLRGVRPQLSPSRFDRQLHRSLVPSRGSRPVPLVVDGPTRRLRGRCSG